MLKIDEDRVEGLLADLEAEHLIDDSAEVRLSAAGAAVFDEVLPLVSEVTTRLVDDIALPRIVRLPCKY